MRSTIVFLSRPVASSVIGVCLGITMSIIFTPFLEESCMEAMDHAKSDQGLQVAQKPNLLSLKEVKESLKEITVHGLDNSQSADKRGDHVERMNQDENDISVQENKAESPRNLQALPRRIHSKPSRPRYAYKELGIREKLFVAVLTSRDTLATFGVAVNLTLSHYVTKVVFFVESTEEVRQHGMTVVTLNTRRATLPLLALKYIRAKVPTTYDYYYFVSDVTYVRGSHIFDFVGHISISEDLYVGARNPYSKRKSCGLDGGIVISQRLLAMTFTVLDWCILNSTSTNPSENFGRCISHGTGLTCSSRLGPNVYGAFNKEGMDFDADIATLQHNSSFINTLTVSPLPDHLSAYKLHKYFCQLEINTTLKEISDIKGRIVALSIYTPAGKEGLTWPIGVPASMKPNNRFEVLQWDYFTHTHIYPNNDFVNELPLAGVDRQDVDEILRVSLDKMNVDHSDRYTLHRLVNGYRRFDAQRGMEYILDLEIHDADIKSIKPTRVNIIRPLGFVEVVPMPYVTEIVQVNLVLPVRIYEQTSIGTLLEAFSQLCIRSNERVYLTILLVYDNDNNVGEEPDQFALLRSSVTSYVRKYGDAVKMALIQIRASGEYLSEITIMDLVTDNYSGPPIISLCSPGMVLSKEYINRLRTNAVLGWQVYFPIAFFQYKPNLIFADDKAPPSVIEIKRGLGFFDTNSYEHCSFYVADYLTARKSIRTDSIRAFDLFGMFVHQHSLHVFRAVEPALKHFYRDLACPKDMTADMKARCEKRRADGLASKSRLATLVFEYREKAKKNENVK